MRRLSRLSSDRALLALLVLGIGVLSLPAIIYKGDPNAYREEARSLILRHELQVDESVAKLQDSEGQYFYKNTRTGSHFSKYGIFNSFFSLPPMLLEYWVNGELAPLSSSPDRVNYLNVYNLVITAAFALLLFATFLEFTKKRRLAFLFVLLVFYSTYVWNYSRAQSTEIIHALLFTAFFLARSRLTPDRTASWKERAWPWCLIGVLFLMRISYVLLAAVYALEFFEDYRRRKRAAFSKKERRKWFSAVLVPLAITFAIFVITNRLRFGKWLSSGYDQWHWHNLVHEQQWTHLEGIYGLLFSKQFGMLIHFPLLLLSFLGFRKFRKGFPRDARFLAINFCAFLVGIGLLPMWEGQWCYGPRYMIFQLPVMALPALLFTEDFFKGGWSLGKRLFAFGFSSLLLYSTVLQIIVNRFDFFAYYGIAGPLEGKLGREQASYFSDRTFGSIYFDLWAANDHLEKLPYVKYLEDQHFSKEGIEFYKTSLSHYIEHPNLYWWQ
jgi:hypothetical protein